MSADENSAVSIDLSLLEPSSSWILRARDLPAHLVVVAATYRLPPCNQGCLTGRSSRLPTPSLLRGKRNLYSLIPVRFFRVPVGKWTTSLTTPPPPSRKRSMT